MLLDDAGLAGFPASSHRGTQGEGAALSRSCCSYSREQEHKRGTVKPRKPTESLDLEHGIKTSIHIPLAKENRMTKPKVKGTVK